VGALDGVGTQRAAGSATAGTECPVEAVNVGWGECLERHRSDVRQDVGAENRAVEGSRVWSYCPVDGWQPPVGEVSPERQPVRLHIRLPVKCGQDGGPGLLRIPFRRVPGVPFPPAFPGGRVTARLDNHHPLIPALPDMSPWSAHVSASFVLGSLPAQSSFSPMTRSYAWRASRNEGP